MDKISLDDIFNKGSFQDVKQIVELFSAASKELNKAINATTRALKKLDTQLEGNKDQLNTNLKSLKNVTDEGLGALIASNNKLVAENKKLTEQFDKQQKEIDKLKESLKGVNEAKKKATSIEKERLRLNKKLTEGTKEERQEVAKLREELRIQNAELRMQARESGRAANAYTRLVKQTRDAKNEAKKLGAEYGRTSKEFRRAQKEAQRLDRQLKKLDSSVGDNQREVGNYGKALGGLTNILGAAGIVGGVQGAISVFTDLIDVTQEFEQQMARVQAISGATGAEFQKLKDDALRLGASTSKTAVEVGSLQEEYAKLGFSTQEILDATEATLNLSIATQSDLATSASVAGATLRGLGLEATEMSRVTDVMADSFTKSALDLNKFQNSMKFVAPIAKAAGVSLEETTGLLASLADAGISGSSAGTALRRILGEVAKTGKPANEAIKDLAKTGLTLEDAFDEVGRTAQTALLVLAENTEKSDALAESFKSSAGAAKEMADTVEDTLTGDIAKLGSAWDGLLLSLSGSGSIFRDVVQWLTSAVNWVTELVEQEGALATFLSVLNGSVATFMLLNNLIDALTEGEQELVDTVKSHQEVYEEREASIKRQQLELTGMLATLKDANTTEEERRLIIRKLNADYKEYLPNLIDEADSYDEIAEAVNAANKALITKQILTTEEIELNKAIKDQIAIAKDRKKTIEEEEAAIDALFQQTIELRRELDKTASSEFFIPEIDTRKLVEGESEISRLNDEIFRREKALQDYKEGLNDLTDTDATARVRQMTDDLLALFGLERPTITDDESSRAPSAATASDADGFKTREEILKRILELQKLNNQERDKAISTQRPKFIEQNEQEIEQLERLLEGRKKEEERLKRISELRERNAQIKEELATERALPTEQQSPERINQLSGELEKNIELINGLVLVRRKAVEDIVELQGVQLVQLETQSEEEEKVTDELQKQADLRARMVLLQDNLRDSLSTPIGEGIVEGLKTQIEDAAVLAGVEATLQAIKQGKSGAEAISVGAQTVAGVKVFEAIVSRKEGGYVEGYTGNVGTNTAIPAYLHGQEHVINAEQTTKYGLKGLDAKGFDRVIESGYLTQFSTVNEQAVNAIVPIQNIVVNSEIDYDKLGKSVGENIPANDFSFIGQHLVHSKKQSNKTEKTIYKSHFKPYYK